MVTETTDVQKFLKKISQDPRTLEMFRYLVNGAGIRVVNYHNTNDVDAGRFETEVKYFSEHFSPVTLKDLDIFFEERKWPHDKPGLIMNIFEGYRNHYDVMFPILEKYGFTGWFYIPALLTELPLENQADVARSHRLRVTSDDMYPDGRVMINGSEIREISRHHVICCHTGTHFEITKETSDEDMYREIVQSKRLLETYTGKPVDVFCWLAGEEYNYNKKAHKYLAEAGYRYVLSNLKMEKIK